MGHQGYKIMANWFDTFLARRNAAKGLTVSMQPGGFVTEVRGLNYRNLANDTNSLQAVQLRNELVYACINIKATASLDPRLIVQKRVTRRGKTEYEEIAGHPFRQLMMRPNEHMTESDLMKAAMVSWDVSNPRRFYCEKEYKNGLLIGLHPLDPGSMKPKFGQSRQLIGYTYGSGNDKKEYSLDDLLIRSAPAWYDPPPMIAALGATESDSAQTDYVRAFFANGGIPPGFLKYQTPLNDKQREDIREKWRAIYGNRHGNQHDVGVLDINATWQETGATLDKLQSQALRSIAESRICMVFGVPPLIVYAYVGLLRATYSNLKEAWAGFWDATMSPAFKEWRMFWLWELLTEFEEATAINSEAVRLHYDMSQVAALQEDVDAIQKRARDNFQAGGVSFNEFRGAIGALPLNGGDDLYVARPMTSLAAMLIPVAEPTIDPAIPPKARKDRTGSGVQVTERRMEQALQSYLASQYRSAAEAARA